MIKDKNKGTGIFYKVPKFQQGGLTMGTGYRDPNKDMYRNIGDSAIYKNGISGAASGANATGASITNASKQVRNPPNSSFSGNLLYNPTKGVQEQAIKAPEVKGLYQPTPEPIKPVAPKATTPTDPTKGITLEGAGSVAGAANAVAQPALALLDDKDPYTHTTKEAVGTTASSAVSGAVAGIGMTTALSTAGIIGGSAAVGAAAGSVVPIIGTVIGAVVGIGLGLWKSSKKKKQAKELTAARNRKKSLAHQGTLKKQQELRDKNIVSVASSQYTNRPAGTPGGYLTQN